MPYDRVYLRQKLGNEVKTVTAEEQPTGRQVVFYPRSLEEREKIARGLIRRMLVEFHQEWSALRSREIDRTWVLTANALLDRHSHRLYDVICDVETIVDQDFAVKIRCLSADMIETTNILVMIGRGEECCRRGDALAKEALRHAERCLTLRRAAEEAR
jgi:hypothetical protein